MQPGFLLKKQEGEDKDVREERRFRAHMEEAFKKSLMDEVDDSFNPPAERGTRRRVDKSSKQRPSLSGSWQQGHSAAYSTPFPIQVVCKGFIARGQEIAVAHGSCDTAARGFPRAMNPLQTT